MIHPKNEGILIVGAGCFGVSTAYHLLQRGYTNVTVVDRAETLPAPDGGSNDLNRIVRSSYSDVFYTQLAREAIASWKNREIWGDTYHESGVLVLGASGSGEQTYADDSYKNDVSCGAHVQLLDVEDAVRAVFPDTVVTGAFKGPAFFNYDGGWANAGKGTARLIEHVRTLGAKVISSKGVKRLLRQNGRTTGIECTDGSIFNASLVILATGSWTPSAFPELDLGQICLATGQCVAMVQLTEEEAGVYKDSPVVLDFSSGFYIFPPNEQNVVKVAIHAAGYAHYEGSNPAISTPRTSTSHPTDGLLIPRAALEALRSHLRDLYPELAEKPFSGTRLCWYGFFISIRVAQRNPNPDGNPIAPRYNDSPDGDWVIGRYPMDESLILATAGSGHAYKFLPVIGKLVADLVEDKMEPELAAKFAVNREVSKKDLSRAGDVLTLNLDELCVPEDLQPKKAVAAA
ncbi:hypothetical protein D9619_001973 [Psilocybe cf. subviscida]|uniref:FAD dependent oxidoreductase domain-containing protein n=1 Tax=Psilocybe cf. subviscida TaxID=2480587 RepID=A0A8H5F3F3_9AGAR|nr:hypothetical protein D9619_001973 [Psilocybe cf. subviscida]